MQEHYNPLKMACDFKILGVIFYRIVGFAASRNLIRRNYYQIRQSSIKRIATMLLIMPLGSIVNTGYESQFLLGNQLKKSI